MQTILVTGGAGFIGSHIAAAFALRGDCRVVVCDFFGTDDKWHNLSKHGVHEVIAPNDLFYWLGEHGETIAAVYHMGAISSTTETNVDLILQTNFTLSVLLWEWCTANEKRFIYASSGATYGDGTAGFDDNGSLAHLNTLRPLNPYGWSKHLFDRYVAQKIEAKEAVPPQWVGLKFFNVYGPNEYHKEGQRSVVAQFAPAAMKGEAVKLFKSLHPEYKDGGQARDFVYVKDCTNVMLWFYDNPGVNGLFNLGTGQARSFDDLAKAIFTALGKPANIAYIDMPVALAKQYQYFTQADMTRLRQAGYAAPFTSLEDGVRDYVQHYLTQADPYF